MTLGIPQVVDDLYAGTLDDAAWHRAIMAIANMVRASGAMLYAVNPSNRHILRDENYGFDPAVAEDYRRYWTHQDCRQIHLMAAPVGQPVTEWMMPIPEWRRSPILNEFLLPADAPHFMPAWIHKSETKLVTLSFQGNRKRGPFDAHDIETYRQILPHLGRALEIRDRLEGAQIRTDTLAQRVDTLSFGVAILDAAGRILEVNAVLQELMRTDCGIRRKGDGTLCVREPAGGELARWIGSGMAPAHIADGLLKVPRVNALPLSVLVTPLPVGRTSWIGADPRWLVLVFDPDRRLQVSAPLIARDLGISSREAEVTALLVGGYNLRELAQRLGVSTHTVRAQLKSVFRKTGIRSQSDLIRRIALGPAGWLRRADP